MEDAEQHLTPIGVEPWESSDWLLADRTDLPTWLRELIARHREAVDEFGAAARHVVGLQHDQEDAARAWRRKVRDSAATGKAKPKASFDAEVSEAEVGVASEDLVVAREDLALVAMDVLAEMRSPERWAEAVAHLDGCSEALQHAIAKGPAAFNEQLKADARELISSVEAAGHGVEDISQTEDEKEDADELSDA